MKRSYLAIPIAIAAFVAACSTDVPMPTENAMRLPGGLRLSISGAVNTDMYNTADGTCSNVNSNLYPSQFAVGLDGNPSTIGAGTYWVRVIEPGGAILGTSESANFVVGGVQTCFQVWDLVKKQSDGSQGFDVSTNGGGEYRLLVSETSDFTPGDGTKSDNFKIRSYFEEPDCEELQNCPEATALFSIVKFYDANANGVQDLGENPITGWQVDLSLGTFNGTVSTPFDEVVEEGTGYDATELMPSTGTWVATTPINVNGTVETTDVPVVFGNVCLAGGNGRTLGFWSNKNGQNTMNDGGTVAPELGLLNGLPLANATGDQPDFTSYNGFRTWLLNGTATNMAYMLSVQLAAMHLNVESGLVTGGSLVYAPDVDAAGMDGFITITDLMAAAVAALADQSTLADDPNREEQEDIKNALDAANNNTNFVSPTPCSIEGATWGPWPVVL